jgi:hypothetical protein
MYLSMLQGTQVHGMLGKPIAKGSSLASNQPMVYALNPAHQVEAQALEQNPNQEAGTGTVYGQSG